MRVHSIVFSGAKWSRRAQKSDCCRDDSIYAQRERSKRNQENRRRTGKQEDSKALVTLDGEGVNWTSHSEDEQENYALMACSSSGSNTEMSARDKAGLGYGDQMNKGVLSYENEVFQSVFVSRTSAIEDSPVNDRYAEGMHAVPL
ncbi:hypothetical protein Tco_1278373 [Tanacetum coccineum]